MIVSWMEVLLFNAEMLSFHALPPPTEDVERAMNIVSESNKEPCECGKNRHLAISTPDPEKMAGK